MRADPPQARLPVATASEVKATLNGIHSALVSFSNSMTAFFNNVIAQLNAGTINQQGARISCQVTGAPSSDNFSTTLRQRQAAFPMARASTALRPATRIRCPVSALPRFPPVPQTLSLC